MKFLRRNLGLKVLSLALAICAWAVVRLTAAPTGETPAQRVFFMPIQVTPPESPDLLYKLGTAEVEVTVRGKRAVLEKIEPAQITVDVDLSQRPAGDFMAKVNVLAPGGAEVSAVEPPHVWVQISRRQIAHKPVRVQLLGRVARGFDVGTPQAEPRVVRVLGPPSRLDEVVAVVAPVNLAGLDRTFSTRVRTLEAVGSGGLAVPEVEVRSEGVDVTVPVEATHKARVETGQVAVQKQQGWSYEVQVAPEEVTLEAPADVALPEAVQVEPLSIPHSPQPQTLEARLVLPRGVQVQGEGKVRITVTPRRQEGGV